MKYYSILGKKYITIICEIISFNNAIFELCLDNWLIIHYLCKVFIV